MLKLSNQQKILRIFFDNPLEKFHIRELARITGLNPNTVLNILTDLEKENLVCRNKKNYVVEVCANFNNYFKKLKQMDNLKRINESKIIEFLIKEFSPEAISIIGSYSVGEDLENSDLDIAVISKNKIKSLSLSRFEKVLGRKIHLIVTNYDSMSEEFYVNLINGIILYGYLRKK